MNPCENIRNVIEHPETQMEIIRRTCEWYQWSLPCLDPQLDSSSKDSGNHLERGTPVIMNNNRVAERLVYLTPEHWSRGDLIGDLSALNRCNNKIWHLHVARHWGRVSPIDKIGLTDTGRHTVPT